MDLPAGSAQEYIRIASIAAIYVARLPSGMCRIGIGRDLKRTMLMLRQHDLDLTYVAAFWVDDIKVATRIASRVNKTIRLAGGPLTEGEATARIEATARDMKIHLTEHAVVIERVESAVAHVKRTLEQARQNGGLKWFNRAFYDFRLRAKASGRPPMSYAQTCPAAPGRHAARTIGQALRTRSRDFAAGVHVC